MNHSKTISELLHHTARAKVAELTEQVILSFGRTVQAGPFKGMKLPDTASWGDGDLIPKILGTYEQDLHVSIETCLSRNPKVVVNIGCAEGYYAVGLALRLPQSLVYAYDTDKTSRVTCATAATDNFVFSFRVAVLLGETAEMKIEISDLRDHTSLYVIDCEGAELEYVENPANFKNADLIIECHEFADRNVVQILTDRLSDTHDITYVREGPRDPSAIDLFRGLSTLERFVAVTEFRPYMMTWIVALAKSRS